jgi:ligand-binding sensor domain-containing protein
MVDTRNQLWFSTSAGLLCYDVSRSLAKQYVHDPRDTTSISLGTPLLPVEDAFGDLWVALFEGGIDKLDVQSGRFLHFRGNAGST